MTGSVTRLCRIAVPTYEPRGDHMDLGDMMAVLIERDADLELWDVYLVD